MGHSTAALHTSTAMVPILLLVLPTLSLGMRQCGPFTGDDVPGPFFVANAPKDNELAPRKELNDRSQFVILEGQVLDRNCQGVRRALVEVWYAGGEPGLEKCLSSNVGKLRSL